MPEAASNQVDTTIKTTMKLITAPQLAHQIEDKFHQISSILKTQLITIYKWSNKQIIERRYQIEDRFMRRIMLMV